MKRILLYFCFLISSVAMAAKPSGQDFQAMCDSLTVRLQAHTGVKMKLSVRRVVVHNHSLNLHFDQNLAFYPWRKGDEQWLIDTIKEYWPCADYDLGKILVNRQEISELIIPEIGNNGKSIYYKHKAGKSNVAFVRQKGAQAYPKGLDNRTIALWNSHGRYYEESDDRWIWQRPIMHRTVEDLLAQSFVLPYIIPMLENAGAYTLTPKERDINKREIIIDNDPSFEDERSGSMRRNGEYSENGAWSSAGCGFADLKPVYSFEDMPFKAGTARMVKCCGSKANSSAEWTAQIDSTAEYAVYVSYKSLDKSCSEAHYKIEHRAGISEFVVDQRKGGGTWIYLGTFEFEKDSQARVVLDNRGKGVVSADAVKIGGGVGKLARNGKTSGMASTYEAAHYCMQWAGVDTTITQNWDNDYTNDYASRGAWTKMMKEEKGVPIDLALAMHTDAGLSQNDSIVGTLAIYTLREDGKRIFKDGTDRLSSRLLCDFVQSQIVNDLRVGFDSLWSRRGIWDKSYSESRTTGVPTLLLELLSHQNFADMKYALDPAFRFTVGRAVYKGILKTLSSLYGYDYAVQPLPVNSFAAQLNGDMVKLSWKPSLDELEPTAQSMGYLVWIRKGNGAFDKCVKTSKPSLEMAIEKGEIYSFKVEAYNEGGKSFPSEVLSVGLPIEAVCDSTVLIINNFDRISAPSWIDTPTWAGFTAYRDSGVPYIKDISYVGENYEFDRSVEFVNNSYPGFGASYDDKAGLVVAGNTFDYPYTHGKALLSLGYAFESVSRDAFCSMEEFRPFIDLICGKQASTIVGCGSKPNKFEVFPIELQETLRSCVNAGSNVFISGANIASDSKFGGELFGYELSSPKASFDGKVEAMPFSHSLNNELYCVESPDGLKPLGSNASIILRYDSTPLAAAVSYCGKGYRSVSMGVPFEVFINEEDRLKIMSQVMDFLSGRMTQ